MRKPKSGTSNFTRKPEFRFFLNIYQDNEYHNMDKG